MAARPDQLRAVQDEAHALFARKNADYGDAFAAFGVVGVLVRLGDKLARCVHLQPTGGVALVRSEPLRDTLLDLHNYAAMAILLMDNPADRATGDAAAGRAASHPPS